jgi:hypothetical protein
MNYAANATLGEQTLHGSDEGRSDIDQEEEEKVEI